MSWNIENKPKGANDSYSIIKSLKNKGKINNNFLSTVDNVSLEDLVAIKLELAVKAAGGYLYGMPIMNSTYNIVKEGVYKFAMSCTSTKLEAARVLGINIENFESRIKKNKVKEEIKKEC